MSHFRTIVIVPSMENVEDFVAKVMAPYDERLEMAPYETACWCVGQKARVDAKEHAEATVGTRASIEEALKGRPGYQEKMDRYREIMFGNVEGDKRALAEEYDELDTWLDNEFEDAFSAYNAAMEAHLAVNPDKDAPNPDCGLWTEAKIAAWNSSEDGEPGAVGDRVLDEDGTMEGCGGTGKVMSTYNPQSKFDYYLVGGRSNGWLGEEEDQPENNPANWEQCWLCNGTGKRNDELGRQMRRDNPSYTCNGCDGKGRTIKWPSKQVQSDKNIVTVAFAQALSEAHGPARISPYAFVTPDGEWHSRGRMGWFGISSGDKAKSDWYAEFAASLAQYPDHLVVVLDCHI